jgi:hypothetical protein
MTIAVTTYIVVSIIDIVTTPTFQEGFLAVTNIVFAFIAHVSFFGIMSTIVTMVATRILMAEMMDIQKTFSAVRGRAARQLMIKFNTITNHGTCTIVFGVVGLIISCLAALPRTAEKDWPSRK